MGKWPKGKLYEGFRYLCGLRIGLYAAHACFFLVLSLFPTLVLLLGLLRYTGLTADTLLEVVEGFVPQVLIPALRKLIYSTYRNTSGMVISASAVAALWSAGRGVYGLMIGLNALYGVKENRGYFYTRIISTGYMLAFLGILYLTLILNLFGGFLLEKLPFSSGFLQFLDDVIGLRFLLLLLLQTGVFTAMYMALPNTRVPFSEAIWGAMFSSLGWLGFTHLYSYYVTHFSGYAGIFGSVYTVAVSLLWLYFCISILFYGGALNRLVTGKILK